VAADSVSCFVCAFGSFLDIDRYPGISALCCVVCRPAVAHEGRSGDLSQGLYDLAASLNGAVILLQGRHMRRCSRLTVALGESRLSLSGL